MRRTDSSTSPITARARLYRVGLGDCLLLTIAGPLGGAFRMLFDCGVAADTPGASALMAGVAEDIVAECRGRIDAVVVTHPHWDHVSGFLHARSTFRDLKIGEVWLPWTEDPADDRALAIVRDRQEALRGLRIACRRASEGRTSEDRRRSVDALRAVLGHGGRASEGCPDEALQSLIGHPSRPRVRYLGRHSAPLELPGIAGARAYVLAPDREGAAAARTGQGGADLGLSLFAAAGAAGAASEQADRYHAFSPRYRSPLPPDGALPAFLKDYLDIVDSWRRIDRDWLGTAEGLALGVHRQADDLSLALAIELEPGGRVLLLPGDSRAGLWGLEETASQGAARLRPALEDLLQRTVLFKVPHRGSQWGLPAGPDLERMASPDLVVLLSGDQALAARRGWDMPSPRALEQLQRRARGRVLRTDQDLPEPAEGSSEADWQDFRDRCDADPGGLFLDYTA